MTNPDGSSGGGTREGFIGDIYDKVKDLLNDDEPKPVDPEDPAVAPPMCQHDSESLLPPPVSGTVD